MILQRSAEFKFPKSWWVCGRAQSFAFDITTRTCEPFCILVFLVCLFIYLFAVVVLLARRTDWILPSHYQCSFSFCFFAWLSVCLVPVCCLCLLLFVKSHKNPQDLVYVHMVVLLFLSTCLFAFCCCFDGAQGRQMLTSRLVRLNFLPVICLLVVVLLLTRRADRNLLLHHGSYAWIIFFYLFVCLVWLLFRWRAGQTDVDITARTCQLFACYLFACCCSFVDTQGRQKFAFTSRIVRVNHFFLLSCLFVCLLVGAQAPRVKISR